MALIESSSLVLVWWNTSLSPLGKPRATAQEKAFLLAMIAELNKRRPIDILALGEVCSQDLKDIQSAVGASDVQLYDGSTVGAKPVFDTGVLYRRTRLQLVDKRRHLSSYGKSTLKIGDRLTLYSADAAREMHLFVSHWPSRLHCHETDPKRIEIGKQLRQSLDEIRTARPGEFIALMGDYNDDPCSPALSYHLMATRDRDMAKENESFLYNPFWRHLGESEAFSYGRAVAGVCGSYYYSKGEHGRWHTFDQMMFSSAFVRGAIRIK